MSKYLNLVSNKEEFCVDSYDLSLGNRVVKFILKVFITYQMSNVAHDKKYTDHMTVHKPREYKEYLV